MPFSAARPKSCIFASNSRRQCDSRERLGLEKFDGGYFIWARIFPCFVIHRRCSVSILQYTFPWYFGPNCNLREIKYKTCRLFGNKFRAEIVCIYNGLVLNRLNRPVLLFLVNSLLVLQNFTIARKSGNILLAYWKAFLVRHSSEYETSDKNRKVNRNIYPDADGFTWYNEYSVQLAIWLANVHLFTIV